MGDKKQRNTFRDVAKTNKKRDLVRAEYNTPHHPNNCPSRRKGINHHGNCIYCDTKIPVNNKKESCAPRKI